MLFLSPRSRLAANVFAMAVMIVGAMVLPDDPTSAAAPPAPLLLVTSDGAPNRLGPYLGEILRAEGVMAFDTRDITAVSSAALRPYPVVLLAEMPLTPPAADSLKSYVAGGGHLIAMRPDPLLDDVCGWARASGQIDGGYIGISADAKPGAGLPAARLQLHGPADLHVESAQTIATLYQTGDGTSAGAAVTLAQAPGGGAAACWAYDLAKSVVLTRQGNPANADVDVDSDGVFRTIDLFQTRNGGAPWVDRNVVPIPQADVQMRLLARLVEDFSAPKLPLPRLWYFPDGAMTMLLLTGDAHAEPISYYQREIDSVSAHGGKITLYLSIASAPDAAAAQSWREQGHSFGIHPYASHPDPYPPLNITNLSQGFDVYTKWFLSTFSSPPSRTVRIHQVAWKGWTDAADLAAAHGIALDTDFYHWGAWLQKPDGTWPHGYITGSGQPMKFVRADGSILPLYQQLIELVDEQLIAGVGSGFEDLHATQALTVSRQLIDASLAGDYAALMMQIHVGTYGLGDPQAWVEGTLDYARAKSIPIWNADQWLSFTETRHDTQLSGLSWVPSSGRLSFTMQSASATTNTLTLMIPASTPTGSLVGVTVDGASHQLSIQEIQGRQYAFIAILPGSRQIVANYSIGSPPNTALSASISVQPDKDVNHSNITVGNIETPAKMILPANIGLRAGITAVLIIALFIALALLIGACIGLARISGKRPRT